MLHQNLQISLFCAIFAVDLNKYSMATKSNTTFGFMLANHPNRFGFYPVMFRITRDRKTKRVKTGLEVKKTGIRKLKTTSISGLLALIVK